MKKEVKEYLQSDNEVLESFRIMRGLIGTQCRLPNGIDVYELELEVSNGKYRYWWESEFISNTPENRALIEKHGGGVGDKDSHDRVAECNGRCIVGIWDCDGSDSFDGYDSLYYTQFEKLWDFAMEFGVKNERR